MRAKQSYDELIMAIPDQVQGLCNRVYTPPCMILLSSINNGKVNNGRVLTVLESGMPTCGDSDKYDFGLWDFS